MLHLNEPLSKSAGQLARELGCAEFARPDLTDKRNQRRLANADPQQTVTSRECGSAAELKQEFATNHGPVIVKPTVSKGGSRGVLLLEDPLRADPEAIWHEVTRAAAQPNSHVLVEASLSGPQLSVDAWVSETSAVIWGIGLNTKQSGRFRVNTAIAYSPEIWRKYVNAVTRSVATLSGLLHVAHSPVHLELADTTDGLRLIEFAVRTGGGVVPDAVAAAGGIHPVVAAATALTTAHAPVATSPTAFAALQFIVAPPGPILRAFGTGEAAGRTGCVDAFVMAPQSGTVGPLTRTADRLGFIVASGMSIEETDTRLQLALADVSIEYADGRTFRPEASIHWKPEETFDVPVQHV